MKKETVEKESSVSAKRGRAKKVDNTKEIYSQKSGKTLDKNKKKSENTNKSNKLNKENLVASKTNDKVITKVSNLIDKKKDSKKEIKEKKKVSTSVKKYKAMKSKKDKKKIKKSFNGRFNLDIFDLLIMFVIVAIVSCVTTGFILNHQYKKNYNLIDKSMVASESVQEFLGTYTEIVDNFYEEVDGDAMLKAAMEGMLNFLKDNYSIYLDKSASDNLSETLDGSYEGVGILVRGAVVDLVYRNSPAEAAGIKVGDEIISINDTEITVSNYGDIGGLLNKEEENKIVILRDKEKLEFKLNVNTFLVPATTTEAITSPDKKKKIGKITLDAFSKYAYEDFKVDLVKLEEEEEIDSLIIDLRGNKGGYLNVAKDIASLFLEKDQVIYSLESKNEVTTYKDETKEKRTYNVVILVDNLTASSAEILTAALKDSYGATIIGTKTYGKGKVQTMKKYGDSIVKYTSAKWLRPNGECIDEVGIEPDYNIQNVKNYDLQLDKAIELLSK